MNYIIAILTTATAAIGLNAATIETIAGNGKPGLQGDGGPAKKARLNGPFGVTLGPKGDLYICDTFNHVIRKVDAKGRITTVAGNGEKGYTGDGGAATRARMNEPYEIRFDAAGNMVFVEMQNHLVRRVNAATGRIETIADLAVMADRRPAQRSAAHTAFSLARKGTCIFATSAITASGACTRKPVSSPHLPAPVNGNGRRTERALRGPR